LFRRPAACGPALNDKFYLARHGSQVHIFAYSSSHYGLCCGFAASLGGIKRLFCGNNGIFSSAQSAQVRKFSKKSLKLELLFEYSSSVSAHGGGGSRKSLVSNC
jgi:hypothetical protein